MHKALGKIAKIAGAMLFLIVILAACATSNVNSIVENAYPTPSSLAQMQQDSESVMAAETAEHQNTPIIKEVNYSSYFNGLDGSAVFYTPSENKFDVYNLELAQKQHSPCSSFKIVSSVIALEKGIISKENSMRKWSGENFWNESWNGDINFNDAFKTSCVWYFRDLIDAVGPQAMQASLESLSYGNADISDWEGRLNQNSNNPALTGFWIESSLKISPREQTEALARIFEAQSVYHKSNLDLVKTAMLVEQDKSDAILYGKTGMGKLGARLLDAWFVGFFAKNGANTYFAIYLGETDDPDASSAFAKEMAIRIIAECY